MAINRLTYQFYSYRTETDGPLITYKSYLPFIQDTKYLIPNSLTFSGALEKYEEVFKPIDPNYSRSDAIQYLLTGQRPQYFNPPLGEFTKIDSNEETVPFIESFGGPVNRTDWNTGVYLNNILVHVSNSPSLPQRKGVLDEKCGFFYDESGFLYAKVVIDTNDFGLIAEDAIVEIAAVVSKVYSPWIYYGLQPERAKLAEALNRDAVGMGGVHPSLVPSQALQFSYYIDGTIGNIVNSWEASFNPLISMNFIQFPAPSSFALQDLFLMFDILDGNLNDEAQERTLIRSSTRFSVSQVGLAATLIGQAFTLAATDVLASNYRTINSKLLDYNTVSYEENTVVKNTTFYIVAEEKKLMSNFYNSLKDSFDTFLPPFIDLDTCRFRLYTFKAKIEVLVTGTLQLDESKSEIVLKDRGVMSFDEIETFLTNLANTEVEYVHTPSLEELFVSFLGKYIDGVQVIKGVIEKEFEFDINSSSEYQDYDYNLIILSDTNFKQQKSIVNKKEILTSRTFESSKVGLATSKLELDYKIGEFDYVSTIVNVRCGVVAQSDIEDYEEGAEYRKPADRIVSVLGIFQENHKFAIGAELKEDGDILTWNKPPFADSVGFVSTVEDKDNFSLFPYIRISNRTKSFRDAKDIFGSDDAILLREKDGFSCYVFDFLNFLTPNQEITEDNILNITKGDDNGHIIIDGSEGTTNILNANVLTEQCIEVMKEFTEGEERAIDRILSLYTANETITSDESAGNFLGNIPSEMRYWRKKCPIGQLYNFIGTINQVDNLDSGDYLLYVHINGDENNEILVYLEKGSHTNFNEKIPTTETFQFQGRLFYPEYIFKILPEVNPYFDFSYDSIIQLISGAFYNISQIAQDMIEWYRLSETTVTFFMENITTLLKENIIVVIRNNVTLGSEGDNNSLVPEPFKSIGGTSVGEDRRYAISPLVENVEDFIFEISSVEEVVYKETIGDFVFEGYTKEIQLKPHEKHVVINLNEGSEKRDKEIFFYNIEFDMVLPPSYISFAATPEEQARIGLCEYDIRYKTIDIDTPLPLWRFRSAIAFINPNSNRVRIQLGNIKKFICEHKKTSNKEDYGKIFNIFVSYDKFAVKETDLSGANKYLFTWSEKNWVMLVKVGDTIKTHTFDTEIGLNDCRVIPKEGTILFKDPINLKKDTVTAEFINITDDPNNEKWNSVLPLKKGDYLEIRRYSTNGTFEHHPIIKNIKVNSGGTTSVERVECDYTNPSVQSNNHIHYICPTYGFKTLTGDKSWYFTSTVSSQDTISSSRITGDVNSPYFYVDYFAKDDDLSHKMLDKDESTGTLVSIDRIIGNITNTNAAPFVQTSTVRFEPPIDYIDETVNVIASVRDDTTNRLTLVYNKDNNLSQKFSFIEFKTRNDNEFLENKDDENSSYIRDSLREDISIASKILNDNKDLYVGIPASSVLVDIRNGKKLLIGLDIDYEPGDGELGFSEPVKMFKSNGTEFGYEDSSGKSLFEIIAAHKYKTLTGETKEQSYTRLPNTIGIDTLTIRIPDDSKAGLITAVRGKYASSLINGRMPNLFKTFHGEYLLFYLSDSNKKIKMLISKNDGYVWNRPNFKNLEHKSQDAITIYESNIGFNSLLSLNDSKDDNYRLFVFDESEKTIDMLIIPRELLFNLPKGTDETSYLSSEVSSEDTVFDLVSNTDIESWKQVFEDKSRIYRVFNGGTPLFSVTSKEDGTFWAVVITETDKQIKIIYSDKIGEMGGLTGGWNDVKINLLDEDSNLKKILDYEEVVSLTVSYPTITDDTLYIFITTKDKLLGYFIPSALTVVGLQKEEGNLKISQELLNSIKPVLIVGDPNTIFEELLEYINVNAVHNTSSFDSEQMVSIQWSLSGICYLFYYDINLKVKSLRSVNLDTDWKIFTKI